ncbi:hypothetical protein [Kribbella sp.]|uniref:hypothetical protein n=1 Tax=Kribbella sp. TaxID=1871183 RepID=UPI002D54D930|nr:hypothetical protein [Kribbella sp.]HZX01363.1 hypothetical protein [Kribbella sp.]
MNLQDLRDELHARAADSDREQSDLLPGVQQKIRRTRKRRVVATAGAAAAAIALAITVVPGVLTNSEPDPARTPSYTQNGFTLPGLSDGQPLLKGWTGKTGESHVEFTWTPTSKAVKFIAYCKQNGEQTVWIRVNGFNVAKNFCSEDGHPNNYSLRADTALWADAPIGRPAKVTMDLLDLDGRPVPDAKQQLGVGIYADLSGGIGPKNGPAQPGDYTRNGLRFRQQVDWQTRLGAVIGDRGRNQVATSFVPRSRSVVVQVIGTQDDYAQSWQALRPEYRVQVRLGDGTVVNCYASSGDQAQQDSAEHLQLTAPPGRLTAVTARLVDKDGRTVPMPPKARIGVAVYDAGPQITQYGVDFDRVKESDGVKYRFVRSVVVPAAAGRVQLTTPVGTPFLWTFGSVDVGPTVWTRWDGLTAHQDGPRSGAFHWMTESAQTEPKTVDFYINAGKPTGGKLVIGLYEPLR